MLASVKANLKRLTVSEDELSDEIAALSGAIADRVIAERHLTFRLSLQRIENELNLAFKTTGKFGPKAAFTAIEYDRGKSSLTTRVFADWQGESCKPLGRFYTLKLCPASTELIAMKPKIKRSKGSAKPEPEMSDEEKQLTVEKHISDALAHNCEVKVFSLLRSSRDLAAKIPICYCARPLVAEISDPGMLLMEDWNKFNRKSLAVNLSLTGVKNVITALSDIHAISLSSRDWLKWCTIVPRVSSPMTLAQIMPAIGVIRGENPILFGQLFDRISDLIEQTALNFDLAKAVNSLGSLVLTHGRLNHENLYWKKPIDAKSSDEELEFIANWNDAHAGSLIEDLIVFLCSCTSAEIRRSNLDELLRLYLKTIAGRLGAKAPFDFHELHTAYHRQFRFFALRTLPNFVDFLVNAAADNSDEASGDRNAVLVRIKCFVEDLYKPEYQL